MDDSIVAIELVHKIQYLAGRVRQQKKQASRLGSRLGLIEESLKSQRQQRSRMEYLGRLIEVLEATVQTLEVYVREDALHVSLWAGAIVRQEDVFDAVRSQLNNFATEMRIEQRLFTGDEHAADLADDMDSFATFFGSREAKEKYSQEPYFADASLKLSSRERANTVQYSTTKCNIAYSDYTVFQDTDVSPPDEFGFVRQGVYKNDIAVVRVIEMKELSPEAQRVVQECISRLDTIHQLRHTAILPLYGMSFNNRFDFVYEGADGGTLYDRIRLLDRLRNDGYTKGLPILEILEYGHQVAQALQFLYRRATPIPYRILTSQRVLLVGNTCKLIDVGIEPLGRALMQMETMPALRRAYTAPEALENIDQHLGEESDVYSLVTLIWEMMTAETPELTKKEVPARSPVAIARRITAGWDREPKNRPRLEDIVTLLDKEKSVFSSITNFFQQETLLEPASLARLTAPTMGLSDFSMLSYVELSDLLLKRHHVPSDVCDAIQKEKCCGEDFLMMKERDWSGKPFMFNPEVASQLFSITAALKEGTH